MNSVLTLYYTYAYNKTIINYTLMNRDVLRISALQCNFIRFIDIYAQFSQFVK